MHINIIGLNDAKHQLSSLDRNNFPEIMGLLVISTIFVLTPEKKEEYLV